MKRVLLISKSFYPINTIGALRPSKICKFLIKRGYYVDVITEYPSEGIYNSEHCKIYPMEEAPASTPSISGPSRRIGLNGGIWNQFRYLKRTLRSFRSEKRYARKAISLFEDQTLHVGDYDACFTTFGPLSSVLIGMKLKRKYHIKNWICDFRDPMAVKMCSVFMFPFYKHLQNMACKYADKVVAVSNGYIRRICGTKYSKKAYMIPNGYDVADSNHNPNKLKNDKLTLTYVGALYDGKRDITPVFKAISELGKSGEIDVSNVRFSYAGSDFSSLVLQAAKYEMQNILENCGKLSRGDCLQKQYDSDVLVLSTWNEKGEEGVFPGKFLEYMLICKPVISLTCGELPNSEVTAVMREGNFGVAYEFANDKADYVGLKQYLKDCYLEWFETGNIKFEPVQSVIDRYDYKNVMEKLEELICDK